MVTAAAVAGVLLGGTSVGFAMSLEEAVALGVATNPEIGEAAANREVRDFELDAARGGYYPTVDLDMRTGPGIRDRQGENSRWRLRSEASLTIEQMIFDGNRTDSEVERAASRIDAAALRTLERSEFIGLEVVRTYVEILRQERLVQLAIENLQTLRGIYADVDQMVRQGAASVADRQQAEERVRNAEALLLDFERNLEEMRVTFVRLVGEEPGVLRDPPPPLAAMPGSVRAATDDALHNNPAIRKAQADLDTAYAGWEASKAAFLPDLRLVGRGRVGRNMDGVTGREADLSAMLVLRFRLYSGGVDTANRNARVREISEARQILIREQRSTEEAVRQSWIAMENAARRIEVLQAQLVASEQVRNSYRQQFTIGQRTLLDLLDAENELFNARVSLVTSRYVQLFAQYRVLAASGQMLAALNIQPRRQATPSARAAMRVPATPESEEHLPQPEPRWRPAAEME